MLLRNRRTERRYTVDVYVFGALHTRSWIETYGRTLATTRHFFSVHIPQQRWTNFRTMDIRRVGVVVVRVGRVGALGNASHKRCKCDDSTIFVVFISFSWYDFECWSVLFAEGVIEMAMSHCECSPNALLQWLSMCVCVFLQTKSAARNAEQKRPKCAVHMEGIWWQW